MPQYISLKPPSMGYKVVINFLKQLCGFHSFFAGYPTIKFFAPGAKDSPSDYDGGRTAEDIINWATDKLAENVPSPEVTQIINEKGFKDACEEKPLCVVAVLPHILDCQSKCRNGYIEMLTSLGEKFKKKMWG